MFSIQMPRARQSQTIVIGTSPVSHQGHQNLTWSFTMHSTEPLLNGLTVLKYSICSVKMQEDVFRYWTISVAGAIPQV